MRKVGLPFTPIHLGVALGVGLLFRRSIHLPTFILTSVLLDLEPLAVLVLGLEHPPHGYLHTFVAALLLGPGIGYVLYIMRGFLESLWRALLLEVEGGVRLGSYMVSGFLGYALHVALDSPLYTDIRPFYPLTVNPLLKPSITIPIYVVSSFIGVYGVTYYIYLLIRNIKRPSINLSQGYS